MQISQSQLKEKQKEMLENQDLQKGKTAKAEEKTGPNIKTILESKETSEDKDAETELKVEKGPDAEFVGTGTNQI